jgi:hypothetical protein
MFFILNNKMNLQGSEDSFEAFVCEFYRVFSSVVLQDCESGDGDGDGERKVVPEKEDLVVNVCYGKSDVVERELETRPLDAMPVFASLTEVLATFRSVVQLRIFPEVSIVCDIDVLTTILS